MIEISANERKKILKSRRGGTVPNQGILRLAVGRNNELNAILKDCEDISEGLNSFRIFIGDYGTGKTFLLSLAREYAQKKNICTCHADLDPQKRLHSNKGDALSLYRQLISNLSTRLKPNGGALKSVIEKYLKSQRINDLRDKLNELDQTSLSFDFFKVLEIYKQGITENDSYRKQACLRWLSGEYASRIDSARELGVRTIIADHNYYDALKVLTNVFVLAGYSGLLIHIDEMVNMLKISHSPSRKNNMEQILRIYNDVMQSNQKNLGEENKTISNDGKKVIDQNKDPEFVLNQQFMEIAPLDLQIDNEIQKDLSSVSISDIELPKVVYMIVNNKIELETKILKDYPEWQFLSSEELKRKTIQIYFDLKIAKRFCNKQQKVIKVPNTNVFKIAAKILLSRGITRIVSPENLISL